MRSISGPLSLSADASLVAFVSNADNLIFGDANGVADAFVAHRTPVNQKPPPKTTTSTGTFTITNPPPPPGITVSAKRRTDTSMTLSVHVPGAGGIAAIARRRGHGVTGHRPRVLVGAKRGTFRVTLSLLVEVRHARCARAVAERDRHGDVVAKGQGGEEALGRCEVQALGQEGQAQEAPLRCERHVFTLLPKLVGIW